MDIHNNNLSSVFPSPAPGSSRKISILHAHETLDRAATVSQWFFRPISADKGSSSIQTKHQFTSSAPNKIACKIDLVAQGSLSLKSAEENTMALLNEGKPVVGDSLNLTKDSLLSLLQKHGKAIEALNMSYLPGLKIEQIRLLCPNMTMLIASCCQLTQEDIEEVTKMQGLHTLDLSSNQLGNQEATLISTMPKLECVNLSGNEITDEGIATLSTLPKLKDLNLSDNEITATQVARLETMPELRTLNLSNNILANEGTANLDLSKMPKLQQLTLNNCGIGDEGIVEMIQNKTANFQTLSLRSNFIGDKGAEQIATITSLLDLNLRDNKISDVGAGQLIYNLVKLKLFDISRNQISPGLERDINAAFE